MSLQAVFLDVGHTLLFEEPARHAIYADVARRRGREVSAEQMRALMRGAHDELPREVDGGYRYSDAWFRAYIHWIFCLRLGLRAGELDAVAEELFARFEDPATFRLFPGALELLADLRARGLRLGIVSNWSARLPRLLERLELTPRVDFVVCSALLRAEKPEPAIFQAALRLAGVAPSEALHVGDLPDKDGGARALGIEFVLIDHFGARPDAPPPRVAGLPELGDWIAARLA